ncbi:MAG: hypothetical protein WEB52_04755 [Dehalococcoidia bacterium]
MRTNGASARPSRTLAAVFQDAATVLRQDLSEYGYIGLCGAFGAAILATILRYIDTPISNTLIVPVIAIIAVGTLATCAAALERTQDGLQPDSGQSAAEAMVRAPWLLARIVPPVLAMGTAVYVTSAYGGDLGRWISLAIGALLVFSAIYVALPLPMYVAALFARESSPRDAAAHTLAIMAGSRAFVLAALGIALGPAEIATAIALLARFGTMTTALFAFAFVISMPLVAAMMSLIHARLAPWIGATPRRQAQSVAPQQGSNVATRLDRHVR